MFRSRAVHVLWFTHLCSAFGFYLLAINLSLFIREALGFKVINVRLHLSIYLYFTLSNGSWSAIYISEWSSFYAANTWHALSVISRKNIWLCQVQTIQTNTTNTHTWKLIRNMFNSTIPGPEISPVSQNSGKFLTALDSLFLPLHSSWSNSFHVTWRFEIYILKISVIKS